jgi:hypothetical protein
VDHTRASFQPRLSRMEARTLSRSRAVAAL